MDFKRTIKCSNCGNETTIYLNSELEMSELLLAGKCARCGNSLQLSFNIVSKEATESPSAEQSESSESSGPTVNLDDSIFTPDIPSDTIKDLMEE
ncbi:TPA: hypothetical protein EYP38_01225 [Candidatus Micrarchaeota archaeon]|nr:hypothetical protein [Candidatus Micrarchaeota archaeon]